MFWYDGKALDAKQLQLNIDEPGLCYGATNFSTMRVYEKSLDHPLTRWDDHCDRLKTSIAAFDWQQPNWQRLKQGAQLLSPQFPVLRMTIFPDGREWITGRDLPSDLKQRQADGIVAWIAQDPLYHRVLSQHKTGNYLPAYLARNRALKFNAQEAILIDPYGNWLETSTGNLWGWQDNRWHTPQLNSGILPGIARSRWLDFFKSKKIEVIENIWTPKFISTIQSLAYSNCVVDFVPIKTILEMEKYTSYDIKYP